MNTLEEAISLCMKAGNLIGPNQGELTLTFFDDKKIKVKILNKSSHWSKDQFTCILKTFTTDINQTTLYDIFYIKEVE